MIQHKTGLLESRQEMQRRRNECGLARHAPQDACDHVCLGAAPCCDGLEYAKTLAASSFAARPLRDPWYGLVAIGLDEIEHAPFEAMRAVEFRRKFQCPFQQRLAVHEP